MPRSSRSRFQLSEEEKKKRRREQKKLSNRRARAKMSQEALEERREKDRERYRLKKEQGLLKTINDFTPREQRQMRKIWRQKAKIKKEREKMRKNAETLMKENTPPSSPTLSSRSRVIVGRAVAARNRRKLVAENTHNKKKIKDLEAKLAKYRMRLARLKKRTSYDNNISQTNTQKKKVDKSIEIRNTVHSFLLDDENSRMTSGKKETITRKKIKKQIRLLNDSLLNLHKLFLVKTGLQISYETFRRNRPFWVLFPKVSSRNTCLCIIHANNDLIVQALERSKIIKHKTATDAIKSICCNNSLSVECLERKCLDCSSKQIECEEFEHGDIVEYERWANKNVTYLSKNEEKISRKTVKERVRTTKLELFTVFETNVSKFVQHVANHLHQVQAVKKLKEQLTPDEGLLHIDFSENYTCKYGAEVQSTHFSGSKPQISLHTCVYYSTNFDPPENYLNTTPICTASKNLRHDPVLICAHLLPVIDRIKVLSPDLKHFHVLSDGPSTQYRNKTMFHLMATYLSEQLDVETITWHFSETGHGKGAPDGVGGCIKRVCDSSVARGTDVSNFEAMLACAKENCKGIEVYSIEERSIPQIQELADRCGTLPFKGTFKIHQLTWSNRQPHVVHARRLSCLICAAHTNCQHYGIGIINIKFKMFALPGISQPSTSRPESPTSPSDQGAAPVPELNSEPGSSRSGTPHRPGTPDFPDDHEANLPRPDTPPLDVDFPENPATPDYPTVPNSPTTPIMSPPSNRQCERPFKRRRLILSDDSDSSAIDVPRNEKQARPTKRPKIYDSDDESIFD